jgi:hypothetical protein
MRLFKIILVIQDVFNMHKVVEKQFVISIAPCDEELWSDGRAVSELSVWTRKISNDRSGRSLDRWPKFIISNSSVLRKAR